MKNTIKAAMIGLMCSTLVPMAALAQGAPARELTEAELNRLVDRSRADGLPVDGSDVGIEYVGGSTEAVDTVFCCSDVVEEVTENVQVEESTTYVDAVTEREIVQPVERTLIQPVEKRIARGTKETVTEDTRFEEEYLPVRVEQQPIPQVRENTIVEETVDIRQETTETYFDAVTQREIVQPVERTVVVPVERRIVRPRTETITAQPRFETITEPTRIEAEPMPLVRETVVPRVSETIVEEVSESYFDVVTERDVIQPVERTLVQPVERRVVRGQSETVTAPTVYEEEILPVRVETQPAPAVTETITEEISEKVVYEVRDVYVDQVTRNVIQPVTITRVQPVERRIIRGSSETVTAPVQYETEYLPGRVENMMAPSVVENYIEDVRTNTVEQVNEVYVDTVTERTIVQPIIRTQVQPVEIRRVRGQVERVTAPVRYETVRADQMMIAESVTCGCTGSGMAQAPAQTVVVAGSSCDCNCDGGAMAAGGGKTPSAGTTADGREYLTW